MKKIIDELGQRARIGRKSLSVLIDPDKIDDVASLNKLIHLANECSIDYFFVGGSLITNNNLSKIIQSLKSQAQIPVVLFPGSNMHIDLNADALLFLSLISGRNADLLIGQHVVAAPILKNSQIEILPTGYMLINSNNRSAVSYMSNTNPIPSDKYSVASCTALAGEMLGLKLIYMDAGSGAEEPISEKMISKVKSAINSPLIVGGGINTARKAKTAFEAGADVVVIGNAAEKNPNLLIEVSEMIYEYNNSLNIH